MIRDLSRTQRVVLRDLATASETLSAFHFYQRHRFLPAQLSTAVSKLADAGIVAFDGSTLSLSEKGQKWVREQRWILRPEATGPCRSVPGEFVAQRVQAFEPYTPSLRRLHKSLRRVAKGTNGGR